MVITLFPILSRRYETVRLLFQSSGDAAGFQKYCLDERQHIPECILLDMLEGGRVRETDECAVFVATRNNVGDPMIDVAMQIRQDFPLLQNLYRVGSPGRLVSVEPMPSAQRHPSAATHAQAPHCCSAAVSAPRSSTTGPCTNRFARPLFAFAALITSVSRDACSPRPPKRTRSQPRPSWMCLGPLHDVGVKGRKASADSCAVGPLARVEQPVEV